MQQNITQSSNRQSIDVIVDGELITTAKFNPRSEMFLRDVARLIDALNIITKTRNIKFPELPDTDDDDQFVASLDAVSKPLNEFADSIDGFIAASDKIVGAGVTEAIMREDDEKFSLFNKIYAPIFDEYGKQRGAKTGKYRANKRQQ